MESARWRLVQMEKKNMSVFIHITKRGKLVKYMSMMKMVSYYLQQNTIVIMVYQRILKNLNMTAKGIFQSTKDICQNMNMDMMKCG